MHFLPNYNKNFKNVHTNNNFITFKKYIIVFFLFDAYSGLRIQGWRMTMEKQSKKRSINQYVVKVKFDLFSIFILIQLFSVRIYLQFSYILTMFSLITRTLSTQFN